MIQSSRQLLSTHGDKIKVFLEETYLRFHKTAYLYSDPLQFLHQYQDPRDQEWVGCVAAQLAYGNVKQINSSLKLLLSLVSEITDSPHQIVKILNTMPLARRGQVFAKFKHRLHGGADVYAFMQLMEYSVSTFGTIGDEFCSYLQSGEAESVENALTLMIKNWKEKSKKHLAETQYLFHLLASPQDGSVCKRWCMFLRWMVRKDQLDLGLWAKGSDYLLKPEQGILPSQLIMPVDTHIGQIAHLLNWSNRKTLNWKSALEITQILKNSDQSDPIRYDFSLSRLGILKECQKKYVLEICERCNLKPVCQMI